MYSMCTYWVLNTRCFILHESSVLSQPSDHKVNSFWRVPDWRAAMVEAGGKRKRGGGKAESEQRFIIDASYCSFCYWCKHIHHKHATSDMRWNSVGKGGENAGKQRADRGEGKGKWRSGAVIEWWWGGGPTNTVVAVAVWFCGSCHFKTLHCTPFFPRFPRTRE